MLKGKSILVTGGTGSFGRKFVEKIMNDHLPKKIIIYSRDELKQYEMQQTWPEGASPIRYFIGDIRDKDRLSLAMKDVNIVVHAAALKQVPTAEYNPFEAVKTNIIGSQNVIDASLQSGVEKVISLSTDKAAAPSNLYGATKLTSDKLFIASNNYKGWSDIKLSVVRYGNVLGSRGSVIPFFLNKLKSGVLPVTDKRMTRFSITLDEGVDFVIACLNHMWGGELFVPKIPSYRIMDVVKAISPEIEYNIVGIRPGEKLHEEMITINDAMNTVEFDDYFVITPNSQYLSWNRKKFLKESSNSVGKVCDENFYYNSGMNNEFLDVDEIRRLIIKHVPGGEVINR